MARAKKATAPAEAPKDETAAAPAAPAEQGAEKPAPVKAKAQAVYGYAKGDKDPTTYDVTDPLFGHVGGPRHQEWLAVNG